MVIPLFWKKGICFIYIWKWSSAHALGSVSGVASFITNDKLLQKNLLLFSRASYASWGMSLSSL